jgi:hypothetical protein
MKWRQRTLDEIADMICGNGEGTPFVYRSSSYITRFFRDADTDFAHIVDFLSGHRNTDGRR